jgi:hypothetical protein
MSGMWFRTGLHTSEFRPRVPEVRPHLAVEGDQVKAYTATFQKGETAKEITVAAQSLQHAARKAEKVDGHGELVKVELTKTIII